MTASSACTRARPCMELAEHKIQIGRPQCSAAEWIRGEQTLESQPRHLVQANLSRNVKARRARRQHGTPGQKLLVPGTPLIVRRQPPNVSVLREPRVQRRLLAGAIDETGVLVVSFHESDPYPGRRPLQRISQLHRRLWRLLCTCTCMCRIRGWRVHSLVDCEQGVQPWVRLSFQKVGSVLSYSSSGLIRAASNAPVLLCSDME